MIALVGLFGDATTRPRWPGRLDGRAVAGPRPARQLALSPSKPGKAQPARGRSVRHRIAQPQWSTIRVTFAGEAIRRVKFERRLTRCQAHD